MSNNYGYFVKMPHDPYMRKLSATTLVGAKRVATQTCEGNFTIFLVTPAARVYVPVISKIDGKWTKAPNPFPFPRPYRCGA